MIGTWLIAAAALLASTNFRPGEPVNGKKERKTAVQLISDDALRACDDPENAIALVRVKSVEIDAPGTRSEHVTVDMTIERVICGSPPATLEAWSFTSKGNTLVTAGHRYVIALMAAMGYASWGIGEHVEVPEGHEEEAVQAHQRALESLRKGKK